MTLPRIDVKKSDRALHDAIDEEQFEPFIITKRGKAVAAVVPLEGVDLESVELSLSPKFWAILERSRQRLKSEGGISLEEIEREFGLSPSNSPTAPDL